MGSIQYLLNGKYSVLAESVNGKYSVLAESVNGKYSVLAESANRKNSVLTEWEIFCRGYFWHPISNEKGTSLQKALRIKEGAGRWIVVTYSVNYTGTFTTAL